MSAKLYIKRGGSGSAETEVTGLVTTRKGAPIFESQTPLINLGMRYVDGESSQGEFTLVDPFAELPSATYRLPPHGLVTLTEDASGDELWLSRMRIGPLTSGRRGVSIGGNEVEWKVQTVDCNIDLTGNHFTETWARPAETDIARIIALQAYILDGPGSTAPSRRRSTVITASTSHLLNDDVTYNMPAHDYPAGTVARDVMQDIGERAGKDYGVVIHHTAGSSHLCMLYIQELDHNTYASPIKISQHLDDWNPEDDDEPVFEPIWDRGMGTQTDNDGVISGLVSIYGGTNDDPSVIYVDQSADDEDPHEFWTDSFFDDQSETAAEAENRANALLQSRRAPGHRTHQLSIKMHASQTRLVTAGMSLQIKSAVVTSAPILYTNRRVSELRWELAPDGDYFAHIDLDKPLRRAAVRGGSGQPAATTPPPGPEPPDDGDPGTPPVGCSDLATYTWNYNTDTFEDGASGYSWADHWDDGSKVSYGGLFAGGFGWNGLSNDTLFSTSKHPINPDEQVYLQVDANNRGSSDLSARRYIVYWYDGSGAAANLLSTATIFTVAAVNAVNTYEGVLTAPADTGGFAILMPRQIGHDNVTVKVQDCSMATPGTPPTPGTDGPTTVGGTGQGGYSDSTHYVPVGSQLEHLYITEGGPYHDADQIAIDDVGDYFAGTDVEAALQELGASIGTFALTIEVIDPSGSTETIDGPAFNIHELHLDDDCTVTFSGLVVSPSRWWVHIIGDGVSVADFPDVLWPGGTAPTFDPAADSHWLEFVTTDGVNVYGAYGGSGTTISDILDIPAAETDTSLRLAPDGAGGVEWASGGGVTEENVRDAGHWEVIVDGTAPPVAVTNEAEDDWLYGWVSG